MYKWQTRSRPLVPALPYPDARPKLRLEGLTLCQQ
jgi:hypothetical protein